MVEINNSNLDHSSEISGAFAQIQEWLSRLSSGLRIETAKNDPAGLGVRELLRSEIAETRQGAGNLSDGLSFVQTAEASAGHIAANLVRMKELATQASTDTFTDQQKQIMQYEFNQLSESNDQIAEDTTFNDLRVHTDQTIKVHFGTGQIIDIETQNVPIIEGDLVRNAASAVEKVNQAVHEMSAYRGELGAQANRLAAAAERADEQAENLTQSESRISDLDMALAAASTTAEKLIAQSAVAVQVHADSLSQVILKLMG